MKKTLLIFFVAVILLAFMVYFLGTPPSVPYEEFAPKLLDTLHQHGYVTTEQKMANQRDIALPWRVVLHRALDLRPRPNFEVIAGGLPNAGECYTVQLGHSGEIDCLVRYADSRAAVVEIRTGSMGLNAAATLESVVREQFPGLPVRVVEKPRR